MATTRFIRTCQGLRYIAARKAVATISTPFAEHKICHITFGNSGIFVQLPYFRFQDGIASSIEIEPGSGPPYKLALDAHGKITSHLVKLSHQKDGFCHFSQHGKVQGSVKRRSFRLDDSIGLVFQLSAFFPSGFDLFDPATAKKKDRAYLRFRSIDRHVFGVQIEGEWRRKDDIASNIRPVGGQAGPHARLVHRRTGRRLQAFFLGPPPGSSLGSHVLLVSCTRIRPPEGVSTPIAVLFGGWDPHEIKRGDPQVEQTGCLACLYPVSSPAKLREKLGSIDIDVPGRAG